MGCHREGVIVALAAVCTPGHINYPKDRRYSGVTAALQPLARLQQLEEQRLSPPAATAVAAAAAAVVVAAAVVAAAAVVVAAAVAVVVLGDAHGKRDRVLQHQIRKQKERH